MKKTIYLILSIEKDEFKKLAKRGRKLKEMQYLNAFPIFADKNKKDAINDCRDNNKRKSTHTNFYIELNLY